jgi:hypothetical protein
MLNFLLAWSRCLKNSDYTHGLFVLVYCWFHSSTLLNLCWFGWEYGPVLRDARPELDNYGLLVCKNEIGFWVRIG